MKDKSYSLLDDQGALKKKILVLSLLICWLEVAK